MCASLTRLMFVKYSLTEYKRVKSTVFNLRLNTGSDGDDETKGDKLFQTRAAVTKNAWSPFVECFDCGMTSAAIFEYRSRHRESASAKRVSWQTGTVVQYDAGSEMRAVPDSTLLSLELVTNGGCGVTELRDRASELSRSVVWQHVVWTEVDRVARWADLQELNFRNPVASKPWKRWATGELVWPPTCECCEFVK